MNDPLISIIIPIFNRAHLISETMDSILAQTYTNWECIFVDDGSTDNSKEVIQEYVEKDKRFQLYDRPDDRPKGANTCRNYGLELSNGNYINWFDSDDLMQPNKLELQVNQIINSDYDFVVSQSDVLNKIQGVNYGKRSNSLISKDPFNDFIAMNIFWLILSPLWKKEFLKSNNITFDEELFQSQDYDYHIRALKFSTNYGFTNEILVTIVEHENNLNSDLHSNKTKLNSHVLVKKRIIEGYYGPIKPETKLEVFNHLILTYKTSLKKREFKSATFIKHNLFKFLSKMPISLMKRLFLYCKINLIYLTFLFFSKGDTLLTKVG